jgi:superfamily II DNA or RNA helicase
MSLQTHTWKISYDSANNNPIAEFYIPALERSIQYDRKAGFFNSSILSKVASGLGAMLHNNGRMRLIMGCQLSKEDLQAIQQGYTLRETVTARLDAHFTPPQTFAQRKHFEILSWLIQSDRLDIRIAIPLQRDTNNTDLPTLNPQSLFHEKVCLFTDATGQQIATTGSNNESTGGWENNIESFHVFCSWEGTRDLQRVQDELQRFEELWNNLTPNVRTFEVPEAIRHKLLRYAPTQRPTWKPEDEGDRRPLSNPNLPVEQASSLSPQRIQPDRIPDSATGKMPIPQKADPQEPGSQALEQEQELFRQLANIHQSPGCLQYCLDSIPIQPWPHQLKILKRVAASFPCSFLIADEVGLGKTIETGLILRYLLISQKAKRILVLSPASVQPQWHSELREKFNLHFWSYEKGELIDPYGETSAIAPNPWNSQNLILASSHLVRRKERMAELLTAEPWDLIVLDEAHHARRKSPQQRKDTPNRLLQLLGRLRDKTQALILLSATPMQIDPIEVFDLLKVLGLNGYWAYGDQFCDYFASLTDEPTEQLLSFWQTMSADYFKRGGKPCPRFDQYLQRKDRMLAAQVEDAWSDRFPLVNARKYLNDANFLEASRQYLTVNTPLKDLMFRHTRDTLRQYYRLGLLSSDVPQRVVYDNAIALEPTREAELYRQVSEYVRHFYRLAAGENRKALGFLMTLYRKRLTSSFYAIQASLQRRLEALVQQKGSGLTDDDLFELDDADDAVIQGLEDYLEPVDPREVDYLETLLRQFENTGEDSKFCHLLTLLRQALTQHESAIIFTQYTDTMDFLREQFRQLYGSQLACYSGRGGELLQEDSWTNIPKEDIKQRFRNGEIKILLCTESASEGLNLQTCAVLFNYDMPWNPMRVEQRIGRIDRIGQLSPTITIHNFYYDGTVEAKVYLRLRDRINAFATVVGNLQPILAQVPTFLEKATMSADPEEENVLLAEFDQILNTPPLRPALDEMIKMDVDADLLEIQKLIPSAPFQSFQIAVLVTQSIQLNAKGIKFTAIAPDIWELKILDQIHKVTFIPHILDKQPTLRLMAWGDPLFESLLKQ